MKSKRAKQLQTLASKLEALIENPNAENAIVPGNGFNESMLIGTPDSYLRLAKVLIEVVSAANDRELWPKSDLEEDTVEGTSVVGTNQIKEAFYEFSPVWLMCAYLASNDHSSRELARKLAHLVSSAPS